MSLSKTPKDRSSSGLSKHTPKRSFQEIEFDRARIAEMYLMRYPVVDIWNEINASRPEEQHISMAMIRKDLERIRESWRTRKRESMDAYMNEILDSLDTVIREAFSEWSRSKEDYQQKQLNVSTDKKGDSQGKVQVTQSRSGDPRYLSIILHALERKCKILGLDAPARISGPNGEPIEFALNVVVTDERPKEIMGG